MSNFFSDAFPDTANRNFVDVGPVTSGIAIILT